MGSRIARFFSFGVMAAMLLCALDGHAQLSNRAKKKLRKAAGAIEQPRHYRIEGGQRHEVRYTHRDSVRLAAEDHFRDSIRFAGAKTAGDTMLLARALLRADDRFFTEGYSPEDSLLFAGARTALDSLHVHDRIRANYTPAVTDEDIARADSIAAAELAADPLAGLSGRQLREARRLERLTDTTRYNRFFRDTIPISRMIWISAALPGFGQFYNEQYVKIPILYAALGTTLTYGFRQHARYITYKRDYDALIARNISRDDPAFDLDGIQTNMIRHNTYRQLFFIGAMATYIYFLGDAAVNYRGEVHTVKKATTLSTICPGAGQFYNRSYWKVPIVMGGFATMFYMIDWNNRGYQRFKLAYDLRNDGDDSTTDEFTQRGLNVSDQQLQNYRASYRRNRDLCIILTGAFYLLNVVDAHVDAQLKDFDISDDLGFITVEPVLTNFYSMQRTEQNLPGLSIKIRF